MRVSVLFPDPLGPRIAAHAPAGTRQVTLCKIQRFPRRTDTLWRSMAKLRSDICGWFTGKSAVRQAGDRSFNHRGTEAQRQRLELRSPAWRTALFPVNQP